MAALAVLCCSQAAQGADLERIRATIGELSTRGPRMAGYAGDRLAADFVEGALREAGVADVQREGFEVVVPVVLSFLALPLLQALLLFFQILPNLT